MRILGIRISGYRPFQFSAKFEELEKSKYSIKWQDNLFSLKFPTKNEKLSAIIGPNNCGKSSIFYALNLFFSNTNKLSEIELFHQKNGAQKIIIEIDFCLDQLPEFDISEFVTTQSNSYILTVAKVWELNESKIELFKSSTEDVYQKLGPTNKVTKFAHENYPEFRFIEAEEKLLDIADASKKNTLHDLLKDILTSKSKSNRSIIFKLKKQLEVLENLLIRENAPNEKTWKEIDDLEQTISEGLVSSFGDLDVKINLAEKLITIDDLIFNASIRVSEGTDLCFNNYGMGLKRSFSIALLRAWFENNKKYKNKDFFIAIEEPELYLHPHATRLLIDLIVEISKSNQVVLTTHSTEFANRVPLHSIFRMVRSDNKRTIKYPNFHLLKKKDLENVQRYLIEDRSDMLFSNLTILVEGPSELYALPEFSKKLGYSFDRNGISVVSVNGKGNFKVYSQILDGFDIPYIIFADGDGSKKDKENQYKSDTSAKAIFVLDEDFEYLLASSLPENRILQIINNCRKRKGLTKINHLDVQFVSQEQVRKSWIKNLKEDIFSDIDKQYQKQYQKQIADISKKLDDLSKELFTNGHQFPSYDIRKKAKKLKAQGKPLIGKVVGNLLEKDEVEQMIEIKDLFASTIRVL